MSESNDNKAATITEPVLKEDSISFLKSWIDVLNEPTISFGILHTLQGLYEAQKLTQQEVVDNLLKCANQS